MQYLKKLIININLWNTLEIVKYVTCYLHISNFNFIKHIRVSIFFRLFSNDFDSVIIIVLMFFIFEQKLPFTMFENTLW